MIIRLINAELVDFMTNKFLNKYPYFDYLSNTDGRNVPYGLFVEVVKLKHLNLLQMHQTMTLNMSQ